MLEEECAFYDQNLQEWLHLYANRIILVKGRHLIGVFDTTTQALAEGGRRFGLASFLVHRIQETQDLIYIPALTLGLLDADSTHSINRPS